MLVEIKETNGELIFFLRGEIDHHSTLSWREKMDAQIRATTSSRVVLDLGDTDFCDSSALGFILGRVRTAQENGLSLAVKNPSARVKKILNLCGAQKFLQYS